MTTTSNNATLPLAAYKAALGQFCSGVTVITAMHDGEPVGFSCQSFSSLSLDPPYVTFCPARTSSSWPRLRAAGRLCINILAADQEQLCRQFAMRGADKFAGVAWTPTPGGAPRLHDVVTSLDCVLESEVDGGDHTIVIARVDGIGPYRETAPLLFFRSAFNVLADPAQPMSHHVMPLDTWRWG
ncbi:flavin reductase family protein [Nocardia salmonicida]|uniref:flavin reductase family protein n=1 Tax=Nocardia salmonicida TaxID=53431 RepID=UPI003797B464